MHKLTFITQDPRHFQIATLSLLLLVLLLWSDFAPAPQVVALTLMGTLLSQFMFFKILKIPSNDYRSPLSRGCLWCCCFKQT